LGDGSLETKAVRVPELFERLQQALVDRYRITGKLGEGGMAIVFLAEDLRHHRKVALKVLRPDLAATVGSERFLREIETTAQLTHPHILPLLDSGEAAGALYYVMPFVEGESLRDRLERERQLPVDDAVRIAGEAADALGYAHSHGVIHRDVKPENILLESGHAVVADFGIARAVTAAGGTRLTDTGLSIGTPAYMSPEQTAGGQELDGRSDLYSLGCVLYEMLSGETPYAGATPLEILAEKLSKPLPRVSLARQRVPAALEAVLTKVLATTPDDRFATAGEFAAALGGERFKRLVTTGARRRRRRIAIGAVAVLAGAGAVALLSRYVGIVRSGPPAIGTTAHLTMDPGVERYPSLSPDGKWVVYAGDQSGNKDIYRRRVGGLNPINLTKDSPDDDDEPAFSADGERIAFRSSREGGGIFVMGGTGEAVRRLTHKGFRPTWSPDGTEIAFVTEDVPLLPQNQFAESELRVVEVATENVRHLDVGDAVLPSWSPHGYRIAYTKRVRDAGLAKVWTIPAQGGEPLAVTSDKSTDWNPTWSPDGRYLYFTSNRGGSMNLWRVPIDERSGKTLGSPQPITLPTQDLTQFSVEAGGREIAYSSVTFTINIQTATFDPASGTVVGEPSWVTTGSGKWSSPDPSRDGQWVTFYDYNRGDIYVHRTDGTGELRQVTGDSAGDRIPRWSPDDKWIAFFSSGRARGIQIWKIRSDGSELRQVTDAENSISYDAWSPNGARMMGSMALGGAGETVVFDPNRPWASQQRQALPAADTAFQPFYMNSWSPDGQRLCGSIGPADNGILTYDFRTRRYERLTDFGEYPVWLPDSRHILFVSGAGKAFYIVDRETKQVKRIFSAGRDTLGPPRLTRDGRHMFYSRRVTEADLWMVTLK
jgi:Tol biopolymer transport system component